MKISLLEKAKSAKPNKRKRKISKEELELIKAWLNDEISLEQVRIATNEKSGASLYVMLALGARELWNNKQ